MDCSHNKRVCSLTRTEDGYIREDKCTTCNALSKCVHFRAPKQATRYGRDRYKPTAVINVIEEFTTEDLNEVADVGDY